MKLRVSSLVLLLSVSVVAAPVLPVGKLAWDAYCRAPISEPGAVILRHVRCRLEAIRTEPMPADSARLPGEGLDCMKANEWAKPPHPRMIDMQLQICLSPVAKKAHELLDATTAHHRRQMRLRDKFTAIVVVLEDVTKSITSFDQAVAAETGGGDACNKDRAALQKCVERVERQASLIGAFRVALTEIRAAGRALLPDRLLPPEVSRGTDVELPLKEESVLPAFPQFKEAIEAQRSRVAKLWANLERAAVGAKEAK